MSDMRARSWPTGDYYNICCRCELQFVGPKRAPTCKKCSDEDIPRPLDKPVAAEEVKRYNLLLDAAPPGKFFVLADEYDKLEEENADLRAQCGGMQMKIDELRAKTAVTCGVGDGSGQLLVHGDYDSIKQVQHLIFEVERLRKEVSVQRAGADAWKFKHDQIKADRAACWAEFKALVKSSTDNEKYLNEQLDSLKSNAERYVWYRDKVISNLVDPVTPEEFDVALDEARLEKADVPTS